MGPAGSRGRRPTTVAALVGVLCVLLGVLPTPADAAARAGVCTAGDGGVTVVVDFGRLGGGVQVSCATGLTSSSRGDDALAAVGISWSPPTTQPGFVCRLAGRPSVDETVGSGNDAGYTESCATTPPADASWSYWKSAGDGNWSYSTNGLTSSRVKPGGFEGWVFGGGEGTPPGVAPVAAAAPVPPPAPAPVEIPEPQPQPEPPAPAPQPAPAITSTAPPAPTTSRPTTTPPAPSRPTTSAPTSTSTSAPASGNPPSTATDPAIPETGPTQPSTDPGSTTPATPAAGTSDAGTPGATTVEPASSSGVATTTTSDTAAAAGKTTGSTRPVLIAAALIAVLAIAAVVIRRRRTAPDHGSGPDDASAP